MFPKFPWTNFHRANADWILHTVQNAVDTVTRAVERIESALSTVDGLTSRVTALETSTQQLQASVEDLDERVNALYRRLQTIQASIDAINTSIEDLDERVNALYRHLQTIQASIDGINTSIEDLDERVNALYRRLGTLETALANKAALPVIINLSADGFPAQVPADAQAQVQAALSALQNGTGAAQVHIEQQVDPILPAVFNAALTYAGDGIVTGVAAQTTFNGTTQEYNVRVTAVSINTNTMTWEMGSRDMA